MTRPTPEAIERAKDVFFNALDINEQGTGMNYDAALEIALSDHYAYLAERGAQVMEWRPISEAPRDGSPMWLGSPGWMREGYWDARWDQQKWIDYEKERHNEGRMLPFTPTRFMLLPAPPKEGT